MANFLVVGGSQEKRKEQIEKLYQKLKTAKRETDPDTIVLGSGTSIGIEEVRHLKHWFSLKPYREPPKVCLCPQAQNLTVEAQAALGKLLEEPPGEAVIIFSSPHEELILPTIVSRCQVLNLPPEPEIRLTDEERKNYGEELKMILEFPLGERIKFAEKLKTKEEAEKFCQIQLILWREKLLEKPDKIKTQVLREIQKTLSYLKANVNPRLTLENLLLSYPSTPGVDFY